MIPVLNDPVYNKIATFSHWDKIEIMDGVKQKVEDVTSSSLANLLTRAFPDVRNEGIKLLLCGDIASGKSMFALRLLLTCLQSCDGFTSRHYRVLTTLLDSDGRQSWQRYPLQMNLIPPSSIKDPACSMSLQYMNCSWILDSDDDSLSELQAFLHWLDVQGHVVVAEDREEVLLPCFEDIVHLNIIADSPNVLKLSLLELPALVPNSTQSKQVLCTHQVESLFDNNNNNMSNNEATLKLFPKLRSQPVTADSSVEAFVLAHLQDRNQYASLIFEHNEEANSKFIQLFKLASMAYATSSETKKTSLPSFLVLSKADFVNISELRKTMKYRLAGNDRDGLFNDCLVMMNYHCQWEDSPHEISQKEMKQRLHTLLQCEEDLLVELKAKDFTTVDWKEIGLHCLLAQFDSIMWNQYSQGIDSLLVNFEQELLAFEEEMQEVLPPNPVLYCTSQANFSLQHPIQEYLRQVDQALEISLLQCPLLDVFEGVQPDEVLDYFIPSVAAIFNAPLMPSSSAGSTSNCSNSSSSTVATSSGNKEHSGDISFRLLKQRVYFLQQCRSQFQQFLVRLRDSLHEALMEKTIAISSLKRKQQNVSTSAKSFHQLHRFPEVASYLKRGVVDAFVEQAFPALMKESMQYFDWIVMQHEVEGKLTLFKLTVELAQQLTFLTKQSVLSHWMQVLAAFEASHKVYMEDADNIQKLLVEQTGFRKTRVQCYHRFASWHVQLKALRALRVFCNDSMAEEEEGVDTGIVRSLSEMKREELRGLLLRSIEKRKLALNEFQRRWTDATSLVMEDWEAEFWETAWRKFHQLPAEATTQSEDSDDDNDDNDDEDAPRGETDRDLEEGEVLEREMEKAKPKPNRKIQHASSTQMAKKSRHS